MRLISDPAAISAAWSLYAMDDFISDPTLPRCILRYDQGEFIDSPTGQHAYVQVLVAGEADIYCVREDGSRYALAVCGNPYLFGDLDLFFPQEGSVYAEARTEVTCMAFPLKACRQRLLADKVFLRRMSECLARKLVLSAQLDAAAPTLESRVTNYLRFRCEDHTFYGLEKTAFLLHCSPRQLQRVMNALAEAGRVCRLGKGVYRLV